jgi:hypothetical protein
MSYPKISANSAAARVLLLRLSEGNGKEGPATKGQRGMQQQMMRFVVMGGA